MSIYGAEVEKYNELKEAYELSNWLLEAYINESLDFEENLEAPITETRSEIKSYSNDTNALLEMVGVDTGFHYITINEGANLDAIKIIKNLKKDLKENTKQIKGYISTGDFVKAKSAVSYAKKQIAKAKKDFESIDFDSVGSMLLSNLANALQMLVPILPFGALYSAGLYNGLKSAMVTGSMGVGNTIITAIGGFGTAIIAFFKTFKDTVAYLRQIGKDVKSDEGISVKTFNAVRYKISSFFDDLIKQYDKFEKEIITKEKENK